MLNKFESLIHTLLQNILTNKTKTNEILFITILVVKDFWPNMKIYHQTLSQNLIPIMTLFEVDCKTKVSAISSFDVIFF